MQEAVIGVKEFVSILNETMSFAFPLVTVEGEVASFKVNQNKWVFFDLKDEDATMNCFMSIYQLKVPLEDGMKVRVAGTPKLTDWGKFSFTVKSITLAGEGELKRAYEILKVKLGDEGLFDPARKRQIPAMPRTIGLISSAQSAAYADFMKILNARWGGVEVKVADVQVQGIPAADQIAEAFNFFNQLPKPVDVLVLVRGGGSLEDLQAFNIETVARAVASSRTPVIVGVGHEVDITLADLAADLRAATPTDAARLVVPDRQHILQTLDMHAAKQERLMRDHLYRQKERLNVMAGIMERYLHIPKEQLEQRVIRLSSLLSALQIKLERHRGRLDVAGINLLKAQDSLLNYQKQSLENSLRLLSSLDPKANLRRGYAIVTHASHVLKTVKSVSAGDELMIQLADGSIYSEVKSER